MSVRMNPDRQLRIGMIGHKFMGKAHSIAYRNLTFYFPSSLQPVMQVICGRNEEEVRNAADRYGWNEFETDWRKVIERDDIDVIDIVTPNDSHAEIAIAAAKAGKHILCEKPLALNLLQATEMYNAVRENGIVAMVCQNYRFVPAVRFAKQMIDSGKLGKVLQIRSTYLQDWGMESNPLNVWRFQKEKTGTGAHGDIASHLIDLARYLVGEFAEVSGHLETFVKERYVDDASMFLARFRNGAIGTFEASRFSAGNKNANRFEINGEKGSIRWDLEQMNLLDVYFKEDDQSASGFRTIHCTGAHHPYGENYWPAGLSVGYEQTFINLIKTFIDGISTGKSPEPTFWDGLVNQSVLDAVVESSEKRSWVKTPSACGVSTE